MDSELSDSPKLQRRKAMVLVFTGVLSIHHLEEFPDSTWEKDSKNGPLFFSPSYYCIAFMGLLKHKLLCGMKMHNIWHFWVSTYSGCPQTIFSPFCLVIKLFEVRDSFPACKAIWRAAGKFLISDMLLTSDRLYIKRDSIKRDRF